MTQIFTNIISILRYDLWLYVGLGLIALSFIIALVLTFVGGDVNKFKRVSRSFTTNPTHENADASAKKMPVKVGRLYNRHKTTGERPGDAIGIDSAIYGPYQATFAPKATLMVFIVSVFATMLVAGGAFISRYLNCYYCVYSYHLHHYYCTAATLSIALVSAIVFALVTALAGLLFTIITLVVATLAYKGAVKNYNNYIEKLEKLTKESSYVAASMPITQEIEPAVQNVPFMSANFVAQNQTADEMPHFNFAASNPAADEMPHFEFAQAMPKTVETEPMVEPQEFVAPADIPIAQDFSNINIADSPFGQVSLDPFITTERPATEPSVSPYSTTRTPYPTTRTRERKPIIEDVTRTRERQSIDDMRDRVAKAREARTGATAGAYNKPSPSVAAATTIPRTRAGAASNADELLQKISRAIEDEAPLATLKELALKLQQERAKPENKTPEKQKNLSETQIKLMRAMTGAMKR